MKRKKKQVGKEEEEGIRRKKMKETHRGGRG